MSRSRPSQFLRARRTAVARGIVFAGLAAGLLIFLTAVPPTESPLGYRPEDTKSYLREMEVYGGRANVLASEFREWFEGLWHGRTLAFTVAGLSLLLALAFLVATTPLPGPASSTRARDDASRPPGS